MGPCDAECNWSRSEVVILHDKLDFAEVLASQVFLRVIATNSEELRLFSELAESINCELIGISGNMLDGRNLDGLDICSIQLNSNVLAAEPHTGLILNCERNSLLILEDIE